MRAQPRGEFVPGYIGQSDIQDVGVEVAIPIDEMQGVVSRGRHHHVVAVQTQDVAQHLGGVQVVVDQENVP